MFDIVMTRLIRACLQTKAMLNISPQITRYCLRQFTRHTLGHLLGEFRTFQVKRRPTVNQSHTYGQHTYAHTG